MSKRASSLQATNILSINREIDSKYDAVLAVRDMLPEIETLVTIINEEGVMLKSEYDTNSNYSVDNSEKLEGKTVSNIIDETKASIVVDDKTQYANKYLATQSIANVIYDASDNPIKIRYNNDTDVDYEVLIYSAGNLTNVQHYVDSVLKGTTTLSYVNGNLVSAIFTGV